MRSGVATASALATTALLVRLGEVTNRTFVLPLVIFYPTSRCNSRCVSCDWWKSERRRRSDARRDRARRRRRCRRSARGWCCSRAASRCCGPRSSRRPRLFRAQRCRRCTCSRAACCSSDAPRRWRAQFSRVIVSLDASTEALYHAVRGVAALTIVERGVARLRRLAPQLPITARATLHRLNFRELPRLIDHARAMALDGISFLAGRRVVARRSAASAAEPTGARARSPTRSTSSRALVEQTIARPRATTSTSGFVAESPGQAAAAAAVLRGARRRRRRFRRSRATRRRCRSSSRPTAPSGPASSTSAIGNIRDDAARRHRARQPAGVSARRSTSAATRSARGACARCRTELEERAVAVAAPRRARRSSDTQARVRRRGGRLRPVERRQPAAVRDARSARSRRSSPRRRPARTCSISAAVPGPTTRRWRAPAITVTAIDWSPAMVDEARQRIRQAPGSTSASTCTSSASTSSIGWPPAPFDAACSNFGPLNCVPDLAARRALIAERLRPGGVLVASVIGRVCPWEIALLPGARRLARACASASHERLRGRAARTAGRSGRATTRRRSSSGRSQAAGFTRVSLRALGLFAPPPYLEAFAARHPALVERAAAVEDRIGAWPGIRACGDHFLIVLRKRLMAVWLPRFACPELRGAAGRRHAGEWPCCARAVASALRAARRHLPVSDGRERPRPREPFASQYRTRARARRLSAEPPEVLPDAARLCRPRRSARGRVADPPRELRAPAALRCRRRWRGPLRVLDLGAGSGWLSHRLASLGHHVVAVDRLDDEADGLGACRHYPVSFAAVQADFDALPFEPRSSTSSCSTRRCTTRRDPRRRWPRRDAMLAPGGALAVMDSPMFVTRRDGAGDGRRRSCAGSRAEYGIDDARAPGRRVSDLRRRSTRRPRRSACAARFVPSRGPLAWRLRRQLGAAATRPRAGGVRRVGGAMIVLFNPLSTTPGQAAAAAVGAVARRRARGPRAVDARRRQRRRRSGGGDRRAPVAGAGARARRCSRSR